MRQRDLAGTVYEGADILDSRDVIARIAELESQQEEEGEEFAEDDAHELTNLRALADEGEGSPDWADGVTLIADHHFEDYAQELAEDIGAIQRDAAWPASHIDWTAAAEALKQDYFSVTYGDATYWIRA